MMLNVYSNDATARAKRFKHPPERLRVWYVERQQYRQCHRVGRLDAAAWLEFEGSFIKNQANLSCLHLKYRSESMAAARLYVDWMGRGQRKPGQSPPTGLPGTWAYVVSRVSAVLDIVGLSLPWT